MKSKIVFFASKGPVVSTVGSLFINPKEQHSKIGVTGLHDSYIRDIILFVHLRYI